MKPNIKKLLLCLGIPLAVGGLSALVSGGMTGYPALIQPPFSPPGWIFPVVWTVLYLLMGWASCRVSASDAPREKKLQALTVYALQLLVKFHLVAGILWTGNAAACLCDPCTSVASYLPDHS